MDSNNFTEYVKYREYYNVMLQWTLLYQKGIAVSDYLQKHGYNRVAIYGMSDIGNCFLGDLLSNHKCECIFAIDQGNPKLFYDIECYKLEDLRELEKPDLIVVMVPHVYNAVRNTILDIGNYEIISITELIYDAFYEIEE